MGILNAIRCALVKVWNVIQEHILQNGVDIIGWIIGLLPSLPFEIQPIEWGEFGKLIGYLLPLGTMAQHFSLMLVLMALWYGYEYIMRFVKLIK